MNAVAEINQNTAVAAQGGYDPYAAYGQEAASGGTFLKFAKVEWQKGQNSEEVALGTQLVANMAELSIGWIRWADGKPAERRLGLLAQGYKPEPRDALGYADQSQWETDKEGKPIDPWSFTNELPVADPETGEQLTMSVSSKGGIGAIGNLCKAYGKEYRQRDGQVPVIELQRDSYIHSEYGKTYVPLIPIVGWMENSGVPQPANDGPDDEEDTGANDAAPEENPAAAKAAAGSKTRF
jgi:hypothetical protein